MAGGNGFQILHGTHLLDVHADFAIEGEGVEGKSCGMRTIEIQRGRGRERGFTIFAVREFDLPGPASKVAAQQDAQAALGEDEGTAQMLELKTASTVLLVRAQKCPILFDDGVSSDEPHRPDVDFFRAEVFRAQAHA